MTTTPTIAGEASLIPFPGCESYVRRRPGLQPSEILPAGADPVYAVIDRHRRAQAAVDVKRAHRARMSQLADNIVGPAEIPVPSLVEPGKTVQADSWFDVQRAIPIERDPDAYAYYLGLVEQRRAERAPLLMGTDADDYDTAEMGELFAALRNFIAQPPVTLDSLLAKLAYAGELAESEPDFADEYTEIMVQLGSVAGALRGHAVA